MSLTREAQEELSAISSIFYELVSVESEKTIACSFPEGIEVRFSLPEDYPQKSSPNIEVCGPSVSAETKSELKQKLENICEEKGNEEVLYDCITAAKDFVEALSSTETEEPPSLPQADKPTKKIPIARVPEIYGTDTLTDRKSVFQAHIARIKSKEEAMVVLEELMSNTKIARATHRIYAYRTYVVRNGQRIASYDCADDGETGAGIRLQHLLQIMKVDNVMLVVTRWYGGVHLGADRFRHILNKARQAITESGFANQE